MLCIYTYQCIYTYTFIQLYFNKTKERISNIILKIKLLNTSK